VSARAARLLRQRVAATEGLALRIQRDELVRLVGPAAEAEEPDPPAYVRGMLLHEGLRSVPPPAPGEREVELSLRPGRAMAGAVLVMAPAALVAYRGLWLYGLVVALAGVAVVWALSRRWAWVARRAPRLIPRGFVLGAAVGVAAVGLVGVAVVLPVRAARTPGVVVGAP
jgi:hypothetical protein